MIWKDVPALGGRYEASENGDIRNKETKVVRKPRLNKFGYLQMNFSRNDGTKRTVTKLVHKLIAETFIPNPNHYPQINHKDGDKQNNAIDNLEWCSASENACHAHKTGLAFTYRGSEHINAKLTDEQIKEIREQYAKGAISQGEIAIAYNVSQTTVGRIVRGERYVNETAI